MPPKRFVKKFQATPVQKVQPTQEVALEPTSVPVEEITSLPEVTPKQEEKTEKLSLTPAQVQQKATAAKQKAAQTYDERLSYVGTVTEVINKNASIDIFKIDGPHGEVQSYSNTMSRVTQDQMSKGARIRFTPLKRESNGVTYFSAVDITVLEQDPRQALLNAFINKFRNEARIISQDEVLGEINPAKNEEENLTLICAKFGDLIAYDKEEFVFIPDTKA